MRYKKRSTIKLNSARRRQQKKKKRADGASLLGATHYDDDESATTRINAQTHALPNSKKKVDISHTYRYVSVHFNNDTQNSFCGLARCRCVRIVNIQAYE